MPVLTAYDWVYGSAQIGAVLLSILAGIIALSLFNAVRKRKYLSAWKYLIWALVLFAVEEIAGATRTFGLHNNVWITHVIPSFIMLLMIAALIRQINVTKGWVE